MAFNKKTHGKHRPPPNTGKTKPIKFVSVSPHPKIVDIKPGPFRGKK